VDARERGVVDLCRGDGGQVDGQLLQNSFARHIDGGASTTLEPKVLEVSHSVTFEVILRRTLYLLIFSISVWFMSYSCMPAWHPPRIQGAPDATDARSASAKPLLCITNFADYEHDTLDFARTEASARF
jgi:hypothetical protein